MNRKNLLFAAGAGLILLASCQGVKNPNISGKWQATAMETPTQDSMMNVQLKMQLASVDTLSRVDSSLVQQFGSSDLATVKEKIKVELNKHIEQSKEQKKKFVEELMINLISDNKAVVNFGGGNDSISYYYGDNGKKIFFDPYETKATNPMESAQPVTFDIVYAGTDSLRLRVHAPLGSDQFINFRPAKADDKKTETKK